MRGSKQRDDTFDFVKGVLVLLMVVYHVLSIATLAGEGHFRYIRFISGSFIFISGYLVARFIAPGFGNAPRQVSSTLLIRGVKILVIFATLNLLIHSFGFGNVEKVQLGAIGFLRAAGQIFLRGDAQASSFLILLPIAYMLILAPGLIALAFTAGQGLTLGMLAATFMLAAFPEVSSERPVLEFLLIGVLGVLAGLVLNKSVSGRARPILGGWFSAAALVCAVWLSGHAGGNLATYTLSIGAVLVFLHGIGSALDLRRRLCQWIVLLGRYSLFAYIAQIVVIQVAFRLTGGVRMVVGPEAALLCLGTAIALVAGCLLLERLRAASRFLDRCYRAVFT